MDGHACSPVLHLSVDVNRIHDDSKRRVGISGIGLDLDLYMRTCITHDCMRSRLRLCFCSNFGLVRV